MSKPPPNIGYLGNEYQVRCPKFQAYISLTQPAQVAAVDSQCQTVRLASTTSQVCGRCNVKVTAFVSAEISFLLEIDGKPHRRGP